MRGLQTCVDITEADNRAEGLVRALEVAAQAAQPAAQQQQAAGAAAGAGSHDAEALCRSSTAASTP